MHPGPRVAGVALVLALVLVLPGCSGLESGEPGTPSPTLSPVPVPTPTSMPASTETAVRDVPDAAPRTTFPRARRRSLNRTTYAVGPVAPTCPTGPGGQGRRYPPVDRRVVLVNDSWTNASTAVTLAGRAVARSPHGGPDPRMRLAGTGYERLRIAGRTVDIADRYGTEAYVVARGVDDPTVDALVLDPARGRTRVVVLRVAAFC
jgi:hypothetical protein